MRAVCVGWRRGEDDGGFWSPMDFNRMWVWVIEEDGGGVKTPTKTHTYPNSVLGSQTFLLNFPQTKRVSLSLQTSFLLPLHNRYDHKFKLSPIPDSSSSE
ncbi:hypothetical protein L1987_80575 [Smallanthus sonchifolius]|uniref:Uncharacterized protein n=1 Tax=Smallanthus sonchifolius TaxID=185202 RepID=A0ACB8YN30_9ASTR|nr:hypothetical protein L1987_80575 [Smallanthus sonchifolius]